MRLRRPTADEFAAWSLVALDEYIDEIVASGAMTVSVVEPFRGRGHARTAMHLAEEEARRHGLHALALDVLGQNTVARALYASLGYRETSVQMRKEL